MRKFTTGYLAMAFGILIVGASMASSGPANHLINFEISRDSIVVLHNEQQIIQSVSRPEKKGFRDYVVTLSMKESFTMEDGTNIIRDAEAQAHFTNAKSAEAFFRVMSAHGADLYYNFSKSPYNKKSTTTSCGVLQVMRHCRSAPVTLVNKEHLDSKDIFAYDARAQKNIPLLEYLQYWSN